MLTGTGGGDVVDLIDDEDIEAARDFRRRRERVAQKPHTEITLQPVDRDDEGWEVRERIRGHTTAAPEIGQQRPVDDPELQTELLAHLVPPLDLQRRGANHEYGACSMPQQQLLHHQARLNRLAQADVVRDQKIRPRHPQRANHWLQLVVLDRNPGPERRLKRAAVRARHRAPAHGIEKCIQLNWLVDPIRLNTGKIGALNRLGARLKLPDDHKLLAGGVVLDGHERDEVLRVRRKLTGYVGRQLGPDDLCERKTGSVW